MFLCRTAAIACLALLAACGVKNDLKEPPVPLGGFVLGHNIVVAENVQKVPISREATPAEWEASMKQAVADRFGRYEGDRIYNIGVSVDGYALAPPGIPVVAAPKSVLAITVSIWDDALEKKLNPDGEKFTIFEGMSGSTVVGSGLTSTKEQQMAKLTYNAAKRIEDWLLQHPDWFGMTQAELDSQLAARNAALAGAKAADQAAAVKEATAKPMPDKPATAALAAAEPVATAPAAAAPKARSATAACRARGAAAAGGELLTPLGATDCGIFGR